MDELNMFRTDVRSLEMARGAWLGLGAERKRRERFKAFTYGRQWGDPCRSTDGRLLSEEQRMSEEGRLPVTNNIIRQMVKSIVGRYRYMCEPQDEAGVTGLPAATSFGKDAPRVSETDARALEEYLISGRAIQRLECGEPENVSPARFFHHPFRCPDGSDCRLLGMLHDMGPGEAIERFGNGDPRRVRALKMALRRGAGMGGPWPQTPGTGDFATPEMPDTYRLIELWTLTGFEYLEVNDPMRASVYADGVDALERLEGLNRARAEVGTEPLRWRHRVEEKWVCRWLTPAGELLETHTLASGQKPPFALRFYPLIDGEVHSLVEDVIDQQKYVNRLISLLDHIISSSAKGVLLYPADQLPEGFTWRDLRRIWANPNGILPS